MRPNLTLFSVFVVFILLNALYIFSVDENNCVKDGNIQHEHVQSICNPKARRVLPSTHSNSLRTPLSCITQGNSFYFQLEMFEPT